MNKMIRRLAIYKDDKSSISFVAEGELVHAKWVRLSEYRDVEFTPINNDQLIRGQIHTMDEAIQSAQSVLLRLQSQMDELVRSLSND